MKHSSWRRPLFVTTILMIASFIVIYMMSNSYLHETLVNSTFEKYEFQNERSSPERIFELFDNGKYDEMIVEIEGLHRYVYDYAEAQFLIGQSYYLTNRPEEAATVFERVIEADDPRYSEAARWYRALSLIKTDPAEGKSELELIRIGNSGYAERANELLKKMESWFYQLRN